MNKNNHFMLNGGRALNYRPDIDGLRAIACLAVVLFHAFPSLLQGGFIGVDVFFVISGYLISSIIYRNLFNKENPGSLNIVDFYIRRIKRIFPALITILIFCLILGYFILLQSEFNLLARHIFGGSNFFSNFLLYFESGDYFDTDSRTKPLLHLWSLGVEEQFYLIFPFILYFIYRLNLNFLLTLVIFSAISFSLNVNFIHHNMQASAFYLPWCRFWELSSGAILSYIVNYHQNQLSQLNHLIEKLRITEILSKIIYREPTKEQQSSLIPNIIALLGICLIIIGIFGLESNEQFPGKRALIPVIGSLLIIAAGEKSFVNRYILSNRPMVFLGLISYPLYLWHWPILSFIYITDGNTPFWIRALAVIVSIILATLTFYLIEPLRYGKHSRIKAFSLFLSLLLIGLLGNLQTNNYLNITVHQNENNEQYSITTFLIWDKNEFYKKYQITEDPKDLEAQDLVNRLLNKVDTCKQTYPTWGCDCLCYMNKDQNNTKYVLFGDSHAGNLLYGLEKIEKERNIKFNSYQNSMSVPFYGFMSSTKLKGCRIPNSDLMLEAFNNEANKENIKLFVLAHNPEASFTDITDKLDATTNDRSPEERWRIGMTRTIDFLTKKGKKILFVLDSPTLPFPAESCISRTISLLKKECEFDRTIHERREANSIYNKLVKEYAEKYSNVEYIDLADAFCNDKYCFGSKNHEPLYSDPGHLNLKGSEFTAEFIYPKIKEMLAE